MFSENKKSSGSLAKEQNKLSEGTSIAGDIQGKGDFRIEGKLQGTLKTPGKVVIGKTGTIEGELECSYADVEGFFSGKLQATETLSLKATAHIEGEVTVGKLAVEPGAALNATCVMKGSVKNLNDEHQRGRKKTKKQEQTA